MGTEESPPVKVKWVLTQESFDKLLNWLDPDRDLAGKKYEDIRFKLIKIFVRRECPIAEELADETINRVARKLVDIEETYVGDRALYFYGVAYNIFHEYVKKKPAPLPMPEPDPPDLIERNLECLRECMEYLPLRDRNLIQTYFSEDKGAKIAIRKKLADEMNISLNTLRMRAHRIKASLRDCVMSCIKQAEA